MRLEPLHRPTTTDRRMLISLKDPYGCPHSEVQSKVGGGRNALNAIVLPAGVALVLAAMTTAGAQAQPNVDELLARVGERVAEFYTRAKNVICIETSTVQPVNLNYSPEGFVRTVESELRVEADSGQTAGEATIVREVRKVNGRAPREKDKKDRAGCTDPNPLSAEPLAFLLPAHRSEYQFRRAGIAKDRNRPVVLIDFASVDRRSNPELIEDRADTTTASTGPDTSRRAGASGWMPERYDVVRVERGLRGPVDVKVPLRIQRRHTLTAVWSIVRDDTTIRYKTVAFSDPDEVLLLPESIDSFTAVRGGLQSTRRNQTFSDYKRFVTGGRVLE